jgi:excisionase family DNA binding protein
MNPMTDRLLYDDDGAAELLSTTPRRVADLRRAGELVAVKDGRTYKYRRDDLQTYVDTLPYYEPK